MIFCTCVTRVLCANEKLWRHFIVYRYSKQMTGESGSSLIYNSLI